jgi:hypothetical protein
MVDLLDDARLFAQIVGLERRTAGCAPRALAAPSRPRRT